MYGQKPHNIKVTLTKDGKILTEVQGIKGPSCEAATEWLSGLGDTVSHEPTMEYNEVDFEIDITTGL